MPAPEIIQELVSRFEDQYDSYTSPAYNETQLRREFLDPFFEALGWDVLNKKGWAEAYKDVIHEDAVRVGGATKAPDYAFRIGGIRKFFVEAKKPAVNVREDIHPAYQLRRYAWSAKLPLSILTDFEEFAVYDCRQKPDKSDKASTGRVQFYTYKEIVDKWDEISAVFSREALLKGSFDRFVESSKGKRGTAEVDAAFLQEIERWREQLARNIALRNPSLSQRELNYAVQMTIDRIIFLRICEDRGIEPVGSLQALLNGADVYARLVVLFRKADARYNSGLFHFNEEKGQSDEPDMLTPSLQIDDRVFKDIIACLYYPDSPYEFSVLPADILGHVYEQFLGKVIRLTAGHRAVVEEKPEVRKAGGVYYTPTYIVRYIVKNTVGKLLEGKKPGDMGAGRGQPLRVLDPACGSGSFLIGAYQYLLDWYRDSYVEMGAEKYAKGKDPKIYQAAGGEWKLATAERKRILLDHIYGVDIDPQAVEVTKLSLLLKVLEGESEQTLGQQIAIWQGRALPDLGGNIKCGNSLIGPDYYEGRQLSLLDEEEQYRVNAFDWKTEFDQVFKGSGGFDAVIGNPPYRKERDSKDLLIDIKKSSYGKKYYQGKMDFWYFFLHLSIDIVNKKGVISFITPSYWLSSSGASQLINRIKGKCNFEKIIDFGNNRIFLNISGKHMIFLLSRKLKPINLIYKKFVSDNLSSVEISNELETIGGFTKEININNEDIYRDDGKILITSKDHTLLINKIEDCSFCLESEEKHFEVSQGIVEAPDSVSKANAKKFNKPDMVGEGVFVVPEKTINKLELLESEKELVKRYLRTQDIKRYYFQFSNYYVFYIDNLKNKEIQQEPTKYPNIVRHLDKFKEFITSSNAPYGIHRTRDQKFFLNPKIFGQNMFDRPSFTYFSEDYYVNFSFNIIIQNTKAYDLKYLLGILNSSLGAFWFNTNAKKRGINNDVEVGLLRLFPVRKIDFSLQSEIKMYNRFVSLVDRILIQYKQSSRIPQDSEIIQREIEALDIQIDQLVYELYGLTKDEINIVESD